MDVYEQTKWAAFADEMQKTGGAKVLHVLGGLVGAGLGATAGALSDKEHRGRNALVGGILGGAGGVAAAHGAVKYFPPAADVAHEVAAPHVAAPAHATQHQTVATVGKGSFSGGHADRLRVASWWRHDMDPAALAASIRAGEESGHLTRLPGPPPADGHLGLTVHHFHDLPPGGPFPLRTSALKHVLPGTPTASATEHYAINDFHAVAGPGWSRG